ncbi:hypothetical protein SISNIDRAFT_497907 [Sistotremastrum niveocremeum HHB9708]|uniref:Arrestin-like N-terminal domain-containing protein n=1 Tax=Sistotremastrum niveocremeum HHB9708 TaxID=1314777 RepID=A0A164P7X2_9AGAM|nr:hypothetical protein SISNIDRAFT_497907 [Sistotremastrum niveocremeum HHB9708]
MAFLDYSPTTTPPYDEDSYSDYEELPAYTARRNRRSVKPPTRHTFVLADKKNREWAFLRVDSRPDSAARFPVFRDGDVINGSVELDLPKEALIHQVSVWVRGRVSNQESINQDRMENDAAGLYFLNENLTLWKPSFGDPRANASHDGSSPSSTKEYKGKFSGSYSWDFRICLPTTVKGSAAPGADGASYGLPPHFRDATTPFVLVYQIGLVIKSGLLRTDDTLRQEIGILPRRKPPTLSIMRQIAYRERTPPPGPEADRDGWLVHRTVPVLGTMFGKQPVEMYCSFALAEPLVYTRGSIIPIQLILESSSSQVLDLLASPSRLQVCLVRMVSSGSKLKLKTSRTSTASCLAMGVCWPASSSQQARHRRVIHSELKLSRSLTPSFEFQGAAVRYSIVVLPPRASGFVPSNSDPLFTQSIDVTADYAHGPRPRSYAPSGAVAPAIAKHPKWSAEDEDNMALVGYGLGYR